MPTPALLLLIATLLPLASFVALVFVGRRLGSPLAGVVGTLAIGGSFACSMAALVMWLSAGADATGWGANRMPILLPMRWIYHYCHLHKYQPPARRQIFPAELATTCPSSGWLMTPPALQP